MLARTGAEVHQPVSGAHGVLVVFHHQHGIAEVAQALKGLNQPGVITLVQADAGLVEHVKAAHQAAPDLGGQADALGFATGQGVGAAVQGQVGQPHVIEEVQPLGDLFDGALPDRPLAGGKPLGQVAEERQRIPHAHRGDVRNGLAVNEDGQALGL